MAKEIDTADDFLTTCAVAGAAAATPEELQLTLKFLGLLPPQDERLEEDADWGDWVLEYN